MKRRTIQEARQLIYKYCAYQERSHSEVTERLHQYGLTNDEAQELVTELILEGYLNEERFAKAFAGGKFRMKKWGRIRIEHELTLHGLTARCIALGLKVIDDSDYEHTLELLMDQKWTQVQESDLFVKRDKVAKYLIGKGYEPDLVWPRLKAKGLS